jgi:hypothetical protein
MPFKSTTVEVSTVSNCSSSEVRVTDSSSQYTYVSRPRQFVLLAPNDSDVSAFRDVAVDPYRHSELLAEAQRLRGKVYLDIGALDASQLSEDGRHVHAVDTQSWHLMTLDGDGHVVACLRYLVHRSGVPFSELTIARSAVSKSAKWGQWLRRAVENQLRQARRRGCFYIEMGGWAITEALRCTTEALRMIVTAFALAESWGGALGITNANSQGCSASILRRIGGQRLTVDGVELPPYKEIEYGSFETEVLSFDSSKLNPRYKKWTEEYRTRLPNIPVIRQLPAKSA